MQNKLLWTILFGSVLSFAQISQASTHPAVPGEYIIKLKSDKALRSGNLQSLLNAQIKTVFNSKKFVVIRQSMIEKTESVIGRLSKNPLVEYVEPNYIYTINQTPNDIMYGKLWGMSNIGQEDPEEVLGVSGFDVNAEKAWKIQTGNKKKIIAIIDTGIDYNHPDLKDNMWVNEAEANGRPGIDDDGNGVIDDIYGYNAAKDNGNPLDDQGHGTHCAGTIAAKGNNGIGVVGVNWDARLMAIKFLDSNGSGSTEHAIKAIEYATKMGAHVMSNSWGGGPFSQALFDAIEETNKAGALFIAASGNSAANNDTRGSYPASYNIDNIISVAAIDNQGKLASFSNYGKKSVHIGAPGVNIMSTMPNNDYKSASGTSMATPHVSGVAGLLWANEPHLTAREVKDRLLSTGRKIASLRSKTTTGTMVDAYAALANIPSAPDLDDPALWVTQSLNLASASPYEADANEVYQVSVPGAKEFSLVFEYFNTEARYDKLTIMDSQGNVVEELSGNLGADVYSAVITGDSATLVFTSDRSVQADGWKITKAAYR